MRYQYEYSLPARLHNHASQERISAMTKVPVSEGQSVKPRRPMSRIQQTRSYEILRDFAEL